MFEFLRDYFVYFWNLLFRRSTPASGALVSAETENKPAEPKTDQGPLTEPVSPAKTDPKPKESEIKQTDIKNPTPPPPPTPPSTVKVTQKKTEPDSPPPPVQKKPIQIQQPTISHSVNTVEPDEHVLRGITKVEPVSVDNNSFINLERLQQSKIKEVPKEPQKSNEIEDSYKIEDEEIESIVEDILNYEEELPDEEGEKFVDDDLQKKIREHLKALQEQENRLQSQTSPQVTKSGEVAGLKTQKNIPFQQLRKESEEEIEEIDNVEE